MEIDKKEDIQESTTSIDQSSVVIKLEDGNDYKLFIKDEGKEVECIDCKEKFNIPSKEMALKSFFLLRWSVEVITGKPSGIIVLETIREYALMNLHAYSVFANLADKIVKVDFDKKSFEISEEIRPLTEALSFFFMRCMVKSLEIHTKHKQSQESKTGYIS